MPDMILELSPDAKELVRSVQAEEADSVSLALWVEVSGVGASGFTYDVFFQARSDASRFDEVLEVEPGLVVVVPEKSVDRLRGSRMDVSAEDGSLVIVNPNSAFPPGQVAPEGFEGATLDSDVAKSIIQVLMDEINPSIASHGGRADLVGVNGTTAFLQLSGGCQGCGMASVTLSQGIEVAIRESVPLITNVVDVTDHMSGANPYYQPAKK